MSELTLGSPHLGLGLLSAQPQPGEAAWWAAYDETIRVAVDPERLDFSWVWTTDDTRARC